MVFRKISVLVVERVKIIKLKKIVLHFLFFVQLLYYL